MGGAVPRVHVQAVRGWGDRARLGFFVGKLAVKEHLAPRLHVRPLAAELFLTDNCNLRCVSCACWRTVTRDELSTQEWFDVVDQLAGLGVLKANFTGGEPLLRRDAPAIIAHAWAAGIRNLHLNTNATLLDERRRSAVLDAGIRSLNVSVDGPDGEVHDLVRGVAGSFARTTANLRDLVAQRDELRLRLRLSFTVLRSNVGALPRMMRLAQELGIPLYLNLATDHTFLFRDPQVTAEASLDAAAVDGVLAEVEELLRADRKGLPRPAELEYLRRHFRDVVQRSVPCAESQLKLMVHSRGEVGGCWGHDTHANVRDTRLADIVDSDRYRDDHARFYRKDCAGCGSNYSFNLALRPRSYVDDLLWRAGRRSLDRTLA